MGGDSACDCRACGQLPTIRLDHLNCISDLHLNYFVPVSLWLNGYAQPKMFHKGIEVSVVIEQFVPALDASCSD